jgi:hypothetical protein
LPQGVGVAIPQEFFIYPVICVSAAETDAALTPDRAVEIPWIVVADCTCAVAVSYAARSVWKADAISLGAELSSVSIALSAVAKSCFSEVMSGVAPGLTLVNPELICDSDATAAAACAQKEDPALAAADVGAAVAAPDELGFEEPHELSARTAAPARTALEGMSRRCTVHSPR